MPFGKYQGRELNDIPATYLRWLRNKSWVGEWLVQGIEEVLGEKAGWSDEKEPEVVAPFSVHSSGGVGQTIVNCDGEIIAWTTDAWVAQVICKLLNENEGLLIKQEGEVT